MKIVLMFKRRYKEKLKDGEITQKQYDDVMKLIKVRKQMTPEEFDEKLIEIFSESEEAIRSVMG